MTAKEKAKQIKCYCGHTTYCDCGPLEEPLKETLEEAAKNETKIYINEREKQTAVEWLVDEINNIKSSSTKMYGKVQFLEKELNKLLEQTKQIEREQMKYFIQVGYYAHSQGHKKDEELYNYWIDNYNRE